MKNKNLFLLFSHGFGNKMDDRGLFPDITKTLDPDYLMFNYNITTGPDELTVRPLNEQVKKFEQKLREAQADPNDDVVLICHSQGCLIPALLKPDNVRRAIFLAPQHNISVDRMVDMFKNRPGFEFDPNGTSIFPRRDGSKTLVPTTYWKSLEGINPIQLYNEFSKKTDLTIIVSTEDEVLGDTDFSGIDPKIKMIRLPTNHDFTGEGRTILLEKMKEILL